MASPMPLMPGVKPTLNDIKHFNIRKHNRHTRKLLTDHIEQLWPLLFEARCKVQDAIEHQRTHFFNVIQKCPRFNESVSLIRPDGIPIGVEVALSADYQIVLREILQADRGKVITYIDGKDIVMSKAQIPTVILNSLVGKKLVDVVELPAHYSHDGQPNPAAITKVFTRIQQIVLRTSLWLSPDIGSPLEQIPDPAKLDR